MHNYSYLIDCYVDDEKNKKKICYKIEYKELVRTIYMKGYEGEGLELIDQVTIKKQRDISNYLLKKVGSTLLSGKSIMNILLPISLFDTRSALETYEFIFNFRFVYRESIANHFLKRAVKAYSIERLKLVNYIS